MQSVGQLPEYIGWWDLRSVIQEEMVELEADIIVFYVHNSFVLTNCLLDMAPVDELGQFPGCR